MENTTMLEYCFSLNKINCDVQDIREVFERLNEIYNISSSKICASEINALSDRSFEFRSIQTEIVACSVDSHLSHLTWSKLSRADGGVSLPKIPLIADPTHTIAKAYGVLLPDKGHTLRAHFIIDKRGILRHMSVIDTLIGRGTDELFRIVKALQYADEVEEPVPADWIQPTE